MSDWKVSSKRYCVFQALMDPLVPPAPTPSSKETSGSQGFKAYRDPRGHLGSLDRKDSKVMFSLKLCHIV